MDCEAVEKIVVERLSGEDAPDNWAAAEAHAAECGSCRAKIERAKKYVLLMERAVRAMGDEVEAAQRKAEANRAACELAALELPRSSGRLARRRTRYAYFALAAAAAAVLVILFIGYGALLKLKKASPRELARLQVNAMSRVVASLRRDRVPAANNERFVALLGSELAKNLSMREVPKIESGRFVDPWGRPFIVRETSAEGAILIYSAGENGVDDSCGGDDVCAGN